MAAKHGITSQIKTHVSTHSHPKVAAESRESLTNDKLGFNTQPPEGGCFDIVFVDYIGIMVSTHSRAKAAASPYQRASKSLRVSTHSRAKAAADVGINIELLDIVSTHSRAEAAASWRGLCGDISAVSTHSHPKVAAALSLPHHLDLRRFNTQPPEGGCTTRRSKIAAFGRFQHTATRRWLLPLDSPRLGTWRGFNTQPPEGGCVSL